MIESWICTNCLAATTCYERDTGRPCLICGAQAWRPYVDVRAEKIAEIAGVDTATAKDLAGIESTFDFLRTLRCRGYDFDEVVTGHCMSDGGELGEYVIRRDGKEVGRIEFSCCGIEIPVMRTVWDWKNTKEVD